MSSFRAGAAIALLSIISTTASGQMYEIRAIGATTPTGGGGSVTTSDWSVLFDDTGDQLLQVSEIISFSGAVVTTSLGTYEYDALIGTPDLTGISIESGGLGPCCWWFDGPIVADPGGDGWFPTRWSAYQIEVVDVSPEDLLSDLVSEVISLNLNGGISNALDSRLQNVLDALDRAQEGDNPAAIGMLYSFMHTVEAQRGRALTSDQADSLISAAETVVALLEGD